MAPCDSRTVFPDQPVKYCLVVCAPDQDNYFSLIRDRAKKLGFFKPALLQVAYLPSLKGHAKMSSTPDNHDSRGHENTLIKLDDSVEAIEHKIKKALSKSTERHLDICYIYGKLLDLPQEQLQLYTTGDINTSEFKTIVSDHISMLLEDFRV